MKPILPALLASTLAVLSSHAAESLSARKEGNQMVVRAGDREILRYQAEPGELPRKDIKEIFRRGGYIQALRSPSGKLVNDDFPPNHIHHHGIWSPWTKTEFEGRQPDFWNMGDGKGRVDFVSIGETWAKDGKVGFQAEHRFVDMTAKPEKVALLENWNLSVASDGKRNIIDLTITQNCAAGSPLKLPEYHYGGLGFRGNRAWDGAANCKFLTASGITDRNKVNTAREPWCWMGGKVDGETCGVTFLCHPSNFRAPQPIRVHHAEPFFCYAPQQGGAMEIVPGKPYIARYRIIVSDGEADPSASKKWAEEYAAEK
jgi:hypothetical protein